MIYRRRVGGFNPSQYARVSYSVSTPVGPITVQPSIYTSLGTSQVLARNMLNFSAMADAIDRRLTALGV